MLPLNNGKSDTRKNKKDLKASKGANLNQISKDLSKKREKSNVDAKKNQRDIEAYFLGPKG